jgi:hypothetical protein
MARQLLIDFDLPALIKDRNDLIHRVRNFSEELFHACKEDGWASVSLQEIDRATNQLCVTVRSARRVRRISSMIDKLLDSHGLAAIARLLQVDSQN